MLQVNTLVQAMSPARGWEHGAAERIWVMDRGMVSAANIAFLRARKARYLVGTPKSWLRAHEATPPEPDNWPEVQAGLEARRVQHPAGEPRGASTVMHVVVPCS